MKQTNIAAWMTFSAIIISIFWLSYHFLGGEVPSFSSINWVTEREYPGLPINPPISYDLPYKIKISRFWDALAMPTFILIFFRILKNTENKAYLAIMIVLGMVVGLIFGILAGQFHGLRVGIMAGAGFGAALGLVFGTAYGTAFVATSSLMVGLLAIGLLPGFVYLLIIGTPLVGTHLILKVCNKVFKKPLGQDQTSHEKHE